jgi:ribosome-interacting GTPase 1
MDGECLVFSRNKYSRPIADLTGIGSSKVSFGPNMIQRISRPQLIIRVYTKKRGDQPDLSDPICLRQGASIETVCHGIHRSLASHFKYVSLSIPCDIYNSDLLRYALVWGKSSKFNPQPQKVGLTHLVQDEDV